MTSSRCHCAVDITGKFIDVATKEHGGQRSAWIHLAWQMLYGATHTRSRDAFSTPSRASPKNTRSRAGRVGRKRHGLAKKPRSGRKMYLLGLSRRDLRQFSRARSSRADFEGADNDLKKIGRLCRVPAKSRVACGQEPRVVAERAHVPQKYPPMMVELIAAAIFQNKCAQLDGGGKMREDKEGLLRPAEEPDASERRWGDPPPWSPWNFQRPKRDREWYRHSSRAADTSSSHEMK